MRLLCIEFGGGDNRHWIHPELQERLEAHGWLAKPDWIKAEAFDSHPNKEGCDIVVIIGLRGFEEGFDEGIALLEHVRATLPTKPIIVPTHHKSEEAKRKVEAVENTVFLLRTTDSPFWVVSAIQKFETKNDPAPLVA